MTSHFNETEKRTVYNNKVILYLNEYYILYCEFIDRVFEKITNEIDK